MFKCDRFQFCVLSSHSGRYILMEFRKQLPAVLEAINCFVPSFYINASEPVILITYWLDKDCRCKLTYVRTGVYLLNNITSVDYEPTKPTISLALVMNIRDPAWCDLQQSSPVLDTVLIHWWFYLNSIYFIRVEKWLCGHYANVCCWQ